MLRRFGKCLELRVLRWEQQQNLRRVSGAARECARDFHNPVQQGNEMQGHEKEYEFLKQWG
jgi:hypothetical protein